MQWLLRAKTLVLSGKFVMLILKKKKIIIEKEQDILEIRELFIDENREKVYDYTVTLCHKHHLRLHSIYGKRPKLITAQKQNNWVKKQRDKHGMV